MDRRRTGMCSRAILAAGLLLCIASISTAQTTQPKPIEIPGNWSKHIKGSEPDKDDEKYGPSQYLLLGNKAEIQTNAQLPSEAIYKQVEISFRYWLNYEGDLDRRELAVMACNESTPATQGLPSYEKKKWHQFERTIKDTDKTVSSLFDINDPVCQEKFRIKLEYRPEDVSVTFAIKGLKLKYTYENKTNIQATTTAVPVTTTKTTNVGPVSPKVAETFTLTKECTEENKCQEFTVNNARWFYKNPPVFTTEVKSYYAPKSDADILTVKVQPKDEYDSCVAVKYWVTENANILVKVNGGKSSLTLTTTRLKQTYDWYSAQICASHFSYSQDTKLELKFTSEKIDPNNRENVVAIFIDEKQDTYQNKVVKKNVTDYLEFWGRATSLNWHKIPEGLWTEKDNQMTLQAKQYNKKGVAYLYSPWLKAANTKMEVHYKLDIDKKDTDTSVHFILLDEQLAEVARVGSLNETKSPVTFKDVQKDKKYMVLVKVNYEFSSEDTKVVFSEFNVLDACKDVKCNGRGQCQNKEGGDYKCKCDPNDYYGKDCENVDYCKFKSGLDTGKYYKDPKKANTQPINGDKYCNSKKGTCEKKKQEQTEEESFYRCDCPQMHYWDTKGSTCKAIGNCDGVVCGAYMKCDSSNKTNPCRCKENYELVGNKCEEKNPCPGACPNGKCAFRNGRIACYCDHGFQYNYGNKACEPIVEQCNAFQKQLLGCHQTCAKNSSNLYECRCFDGYNLDATRKQCIMDFTSSKTCKKYEYQTKDGNCECILGFSKVKDTCQNMCELAKGEPSGKDAAIVKQYCAGSSNCKLENDKFSCKCEGLYENAEDGFCKAKTVCLSQNNCTAQGAICVPTFEKDKLYECICPPGKSKDKDGKCVNPCTGYDLCYFSDSECTTDYSTSDPQPKCECRPGQTFNTILDYKLCQIAQFKVKLSFVTKLKLTTFGSGTIKKRSIQDADICTQLVPHDVRGCIEYLKKIEAQQPKTVAEGLKEKFIRGTFATQLGETLKSLYPDEFISVTMIGNTSLSDMNERITVSVQFNKKVSMNLTQNCVDLVAEEMKGFCFIPPYLSIKKDSVEIKDLHFCEEPERYCGYGTTCEEDKGLYTCPCKKGYEIEHIIPLNYAVETKTAKRYCKPEVNCGGICGENQICVSKTHGNYTCECRENTARGTDGKCKQCSDLISCKNGGTCQILHNGTPSCQCPDAWIGGTCDKRAGLWIAIWVVAVVAGIVLLLVIVLAVVMIKKAKKESQSYNGRGTGNNAYINDDHYQSHF